MSKHLWPLLRKKKDTDEELFEEYRKIYLETYVTSPKGEEIEIYDWCGQRIRFSGHPVVFRHAFSESSNYRFSHGDHDIPVSKKRLRCLLWIKEVLSGQRGTIEKYHQAKKDSRGRIKKCVVLFVVEEDYFVVLEENEETQELDFITAFPKAGRQYVEWVRRRSVLVETKKNPSLNGD